MRIKIVFILFLLIIVSISCGDKRVKHSIRSALSDISYESNFVNTNLIRYRNFISLNGLVTQHVPGMYFHQPSGKATAPTLSIGISPYLSFMVTSTIVMPQKSSTAGADTFHLIVRNYVEARSLSVKLTADQFRLQLISFLLTEIAESLKSQEDIKKITGAKLPDWAKDSPSLVGITQADIKNSNGKYKLLTEIRDKLKSVKQGLVIIVNEKTIKYDILIDKLHLQISKNRILFVQWDAQTETDARLAIPGLTRFNRKKKTHISGILILGGIQLRTLFVGIDFTRAVNESKRWNSALKTEIGINSHTLYAKYSQSIANLGYSKAISLSLNLSISSLQSLKKLQGAVNSGKLDLGLTYTAAQKLNQISVNYDMRTEITPYTFYPREQHFKCVEYYLNKSSGYHTVVAIRAHLREKMLRALKSLKGSSGDAKAKKITWNKCK